MLVLERPKIPQAGELLRDFNDGLTYIVIENDGESWEDRYKNVNLMCLTTGGSARKMLRDLFFYEYME